MWVPSAVLDWFKISQSSFSGLKEDNVALRVERDSLQRQLITTTSNFEWLRMRVNTIEMERVALMEKAYGIKIPAPEIVRTPVVGQGTKQEDFSFDDIGESMAKVLGMPSYDKS